MGNVAWRALNDALGQQSATPPIQQLRPRYQLAGSPAGAPGSGTVQPPRGIFHRWAMQDLMYEIRTSSFTYLQPWCYDPTVPFYNEGETGSSAVSPSSTPPVFLPPVGSGSASSSSSSDGANAYELPDGTRIDMTTPTGKDLCRIPELMYTDDLPFLSRKQRLAPLPSTLSDLPIPRLIHASLSAVGDVDVRKDLASSIVLTGGSSLVPGMEQRLSIEVPRLVSSAYKTKVTASKHSVERACASWIGGSILTSLGSFQQLWLSRAEYEEYGATLAVQRFPV
jgi:Actin